jgi:exosortase
LQSESLIAEVLSGLQDTAKSIRKAGPWAWVAILLFAALFYEPTQHVWRVWSRENGYYNHGPLVPFIAILMLILDRKNLESVPIRPNWWGLPVVVMCSLVFLASTLCHMYPPKYFIFVFYLLGFNLMFFGTAMVRATLLPWAFLFFMVPLPDAAIDVFTYKLRIFVTAQAVWLTEPFEWFVVKKGNFILFPGGDSLVVEDVCAGLRSLIGLLALGACFAYLSRLNVLGKLVLFALSAPVAVVTNVLRIFVLIVVAKYWGTSIASGQVHNVSGWAIYAVAAALVFLVNLFLEKGVSFLRGRPSEDNPA